MKRVQIEPWTLKEKLCLASAVLRSGDQNWMSVSRVLRVYGEPNRPPDWYSQKQCAVQYNSLLSNVGTPKRKKRSEKGIETVDTPGESIVRKLTQERIEELKRLMAEERMEYLRQKREKEEVESQRADDRLAEMWQDIEEEIERDKQEQASIMRQHEERKKEVDASGRPVLLSSARTLSDTGTEVDSNDSVDVDVKPSPTPPSPLLTSLLQSPSPSLLHRNSSAPTISSLLHSAPSVPRIHDSPTLSKLLESPSSAAGQINFLQTSPVIKTEVITETLSSQTASPVPNIENKEESVEIKTEVLSPLRTDGDKDNNATETDQDENQEEENVVSSSSSFEKDRPSVARKLDLDESPSGEGEKDERNSLNHTLDSDTLEEQLESEMELDSQTVEMIVMGPNQGAVIAVHHDNSSENVEETNSTESHSKDVADVDATIKEEVLDDENVPDDSEIELNAEVTKPVEEALKMISDATIILPGSEEAIEIETQSKEDEQSVTTVVKDLGEVSANEMKEIIEGAEVIVEEVVSEAVKNSEEAKDRQERSQEITGKDDVICEVVKQECKDSSSPEELIGNVELDDGVLQVGGEVSLAELTESVVASALKEIEVAVSESSETASSPDKGNESEQVDLTNKDEELLEEKVQIKIENEEEKEDSKRKDVSDETVVGEVKSETTEEKPEFTQRAVAVAAAAAPVAVTSDLPSDSPSTSVATVDSAAEQQAQADTVDSKTLQRPDTPSTTEEEAEPTPPPAATPPAPKRGKKRALSNSDSKPSSPAGTPGEEEKEFRSWKKSIMLVYNRLATHKYASLFLRPITNEQARGYHGVIHRPMDLSTIKKNVESGQLRTTVEFQRDMMLMFQNAIMYNNSSTLVYEMAKTMQSECIQHIQLMVEAMGEGVPWRTESESIDKQNKRARGKTDLDTVPVRKRLSGTTGEDLKTSQPSKRKKLSST